MNRYSAFRCWAVFFDFYRTKIVINNKKGWFFIQKSTRLKFHIDNQINTIGNYKYITSYTFVTTSTGFQIGIDRCHCFPLLKTTRNEADGFASYKIQCLIRMVHLFHDDSYQQNFFYAIKYHISMLQSEAAASWSNQCDWTYIVMIILIRYNINDNHDILSRH